MTLLFLLILTSGIVTFFRYSNFFPFLSDHIYELVTNAYGVTAGGAIMSVVFSALNYATGLGFFFILVNVLRSKSDLRKILLTLLLSTLISLAFGLIQHFVDVRLGNNLTSIALELINATFKDALSFSAFMAMISPLFLGVGLAFKGLARLAAFVSVLLSGFLILLSGSKIGLFSLYITTLVCFFLCIKSIFHSRGIHPLKSAKVRWVAFIAVTLAVIAAAVLVLSDRVPVRTLLGKSATITRIYNIKNISRWRWETNWKMAGHIIYHYPLAGVGIGGYIIESSNYASLTKTFIGTPESAENYALQVMSELGIVGIGLVLWIFWEILKEVRQAFKRTPPKTGHRFILIGAACGLVAFILNIQAHTYIGSYEVKYTCWLLTALIFAISLISSQERPHEGRELGPSAIPAQPCRSGRKLHLQTRFRVFAGGLIFFYGTVLLWNSTHSLSLKNRTELLGIKQDFGFYQHEKTNDGREFRWTREYGGLTVKIEKPVIEIPLLASHPDIQKNPVKVKVYLIKDFFKQKKLLDELTLNQSIWKTCEYEVPEEVGKELILLVKVNRTWNPLKTLGTPDPRNLGVAMGKIEFKDKIDP
jgi:hypothetical protein